MNYVIRLSESSLLTVVEVVRMSVRSSERQWRSERWEGARLSTGEATPRISTMRVLTGSTPETNSVVVLTKHESRPAYETSECVS